MLGDSLVEIAEAISDSQASLLLTSRDVAFDAASDDLIAHAAARPGQLQRFQLSKLVEKEVNQLISISERIAGWGELSGKSESWKNNYISRDCHGNLAEFLLRILESKVIRDRVLDEYHSCIAASPKLFKPIIIALYLQHIGLPVQLEVLSTILKTDIGALVNRPSEAPKNEFLRRDGDYLRTLPSIGARDLLRKIVKDNDIVTVVTEVVHELSENRRYGHTYQHIFNQFMRYPILQRVVSDRPQIETFFDQLSLHPWVKKQSHFWLQFSMAMTDFGKFLKAEDYLETAYAIAKSHGERGHHQGYRQLDDQKAKFLLHRLNVRYWG